MVPGNKFDKPAKSPFTDMMLVPVYTEGDADQSKVTVSSAHSTESRRAHGSGRRRHARGVRCRQHCLQRARSGDRAGASHRLRRASLCARHWIAWPRGKRWSNSTYPIGRGTGEFLLGASDAGAPISPHLVDGARQRMRQVGMSEVQIRLVETTGITQPQVTLTSPQHGVVVELLAREGMTVMSGATLFPSTVWAPFGRMPKCRRRKLHCCAPVRKCRPKSRHSGHDLRGQGFAGDPAEVNAATRTIKARLELANPARPVPACSSPCN